MKINIKLNKKELKSIAAICIAIMAIEYFYDIDNKITHLLSCKKQEKIFRNQLRVRDKDQSPIKNPSESEYNLQELDVLQAVVDQHIKQLPEKTGVPELIEVLSQQGMASGLKFRTIRLLEENPVGFYIELPIEIIVSGGYHKIGDFLSKIALLSRIITVHDFTLQSLSNESNKEEVLMNMTAKIYSYNENYRESNEISEDKGSDNEENESKGSEGSESEGGEENENENKNEINKAYKATEAASFVYAASALRSPFSPSRYLDNNRVKDDMGEIKQVGIIEKNGHTWKVIENANGSIGLVEIL